jgi:uncharacterized protein (DUF433 family)
MNQPVATDEALARSEGEEHEDDWLAWEPIVDWSKYIHQDPQILVGKPVVRGTRLSAEFLLEFFATGGTEEQALATYPWLTRDALRAVFAFAAQCVRERYPVVFPPKSS